MYMWTGSYHFSKLRGRNSSHSKCKLFMLWGIDDVINRNILHAFLSSGINQNIGVLDKNHLSL